MMLHGQRPEWLTFDCYGTLIQWDEGLLAAVKEILLRQERGSVEPGELIAIYDRCEHELEQTSPHRSFREIAGTALKMAMTELELDYDEQDIGVLTSGISKMPPFPEVVDTLGALKAGGFNLCIVSNTDDDIIEGNVEQMGGHIDRVVSAQLAQAYKPSEKIFNYAHATLGVEKNEVVHICASPHLDLAAARDMGFRCIWINRGTGRTPLPDYTPDAEFRTLDHVPKAFGEIGWM